MHFDERKGQKRFVHSARNGNGTNHRRPIVILARLVSFNWVANSGRDHLLLANRLLVSGLRYEVTGLPAGNVESRCVNDAFKVQRSKRSYRFRWYFEFRFNIVEQKVHLKCSIWRKYKRNLSISWNRKRRCILPSYRSYSRSIAMLVSDSF